MSEWTEDVREVLVEFVENPEYWEVVGATFEFVRDDGDVGMFSAEDVDVVRSPSLATVSLGKATLGIGFDGNTKHNLDVWVTTPAARVKGIERIRREVAIHA